MSLSYNNKFLDTDENIANDDVLRIEEKYNFVFPKDIREHYHVYNGGKPERYIFEDDGYEYIVDCFIPIKNNTKEQRNLEFVLDTLRVEDKIIPLWLIPIADDPGGNIFCFSIREGEEGAIYYWTHEYEYGEDSEDYVSYLADSIKVFIESMV